MAALLQRTAVGRLLVSVFDWYPSSMSPSDRKLLKKLDRSILVFACLSFFCKFLDQSNITNAYVSGMKEDVGLGGNDLNYLNVAYYTAYVVGQFPMIALQSRPSLAPYFLPSLEIVWAILTFCESVVSKPWHLYLLRALVGFAEAPSFGGTHLILGSWYRPEELFKRAGVWFMGNALGSTFSGYLQASAYKNLNGTGGLAGWQWLFIVDGIITLPIAFIGFTFFPGLPSSRKPWFLTAEEHARASSRLPKDHKQAGKLTLDVVKRTLKRKTWWFAVPIYIFMIQMSYWTGYMSLWLKAEKKLSPITGKLVAKYSVEQVNVYPTFVYIISAASSWIGTTLAGGGIFKPWAVFSVGQTAMVFSTIVLTVWHVPDGLKFAAFYLGGLSGMTSPIVYSWINVVLKNDAEERAFVIASMMTAGYCTYIWVPIFTFPTVESPRFPKGYPASIAFTVALWVAVLVAMYIHRGRTTDLERGADTSETSAVEGTDVPPAGSVSDLEDKEGFVQGNGVQKTGVILL
ncbi:MFS transporter, ACS family, pantothenate transporter, partial [Phenoliferia sp. Uapishka_3]